jgi:surface protein
MSLMFLSNTSFDQNIGGWNTHNTQFMYNMFAGATAFNQDIGTWNTANITEIYEMFSGATSFDQNIGGWDITTLEDATDMFDSVTLSTANYDALLVGWQSQSHPNGIEFSAGNSTYTANSAASAARDDLTNNHSWTITDGGSV